MSTVSPHRADTEPDDTEAEDLNALEGVTSDQVQHAQDESRAEGEPYEDAE
ncbi:hypothetical protein [Kitasatospora sp. GAS204B]|uniref:hypothetical protein n=1 Tax=unclassified Kitasatospora TaxID=2633591 RepID=UPI002474DFD0|nr:hypothetical protein [Kitasatospora sp. GAS204B]MDH6119041.1 hypothetical protein [Kitasatospora sp. GAS204B]